MSDTDYKALRTRNAIQKIKELWNGYGLQNPVEHKKVVDGFADRTITGKFIDAQDWLVGEIAYRIGISCEMVEKAVKGI